ncbi:MAG: BrnT family toxin [Bacteroidales bacterium]|nr:BrnT family toxin [Bacteroidales bacterium]
MLTFEWDDDKNIVNLQKHGVSFEEAQSAFYDENAIEFFDDSHSKSEDRFILLGFSNHLRLLVVCHCFRKKESVIRLISARKATKTESNYYGG